MNASLLSLVLEKRKDVEAWLNQFPVQDLPLYSSVDIRDAGYKVACVDTNLFPAGFNNLCNLSLKDSAQDVRQAILERVPHCEHILIMTEEHTRNTWYLENVFALKQMIEYAGFRVSVATFLDVQPKVFEGCVTCVEVETARGNKLDICDMNTLLKKYEQGRVHFDLMILNNDLINGVPEPLKHARIPIYPSYWAGWHARRKSLHFDKAQLLLRDFSNLVGCDPWLFSTLYSVVDECNINEAHDRERLQDQFSDLMVQISAKYQEHGIKEKPFAFLKADYGTYGMGVMPFEDASQIGALNRKGRNKLYKGKSARVIERYLLQEGVPTSQILEGSASEVCVYQVAQHFVGAFYRIHAEKGVRDSLNSQGMEFRKICIENKKNNPYCEAHCEQDDAKQALTVYRMLASISAMAAGLEIKQLELMEKPLS